MIQMFIETSEYQALAAFVSARQPAGAIINGFLARAQTAYASTVKQAATSLVSSAVTDGVLYQSQIDAALAAGVPQVQVNRIVNATVGSITPNPP